MLTAQPTRVTLVCPFPPAVWAAQAAITLSPEVSATGTVTSTFAGHIAIPPYWNK